jgi:hypothetical protein
MKRLVSILLICVALLCLVGCKDNDGAPNGMKLASNKDLVSYFLYVPENWVIDNSDTTTRAHVSSIDTSSVGVGEYGEHESIDAWWEAYKTALSAVNGFEVIEEGVTGIVDKQPSKSYTYKTIQQEVAYKHYVTVTMKDKELFAILFTSYEGPLFDNNLTVVKDQIIANFKFSK